MHLTAKGHRQLAERMETAVRDILGKTVPEAVEQSQEERGRTGWRRFRYTTANLLAKRRSAQNPGDL